MSRRTSSTRQKPTYRSGRIRAGIAMFGIVAIGGGLGAQGTLAFFTDSATANTGSFVSGTFDITIDGALGATNANPTLNNGGTMTLSLSANNLLPAESVAYSFPVKNNGSTPLTYSLSGTGSGALAVTGGLQYRVEFGTAATNTGTEANGNRVGSCGTAVTDANTTALTSTKTDFVTTASPRSLGAGVSETACIVVRLNSGAGNGLQNASGNASFVFAAKQPGV